MFGIFRKKLKPISELELLKKKPEPVIGFVCGQAIHDANGTDKNFYSNIDGYVRFASNLSGVNHPIKNLGLSTRGENVLKAANIKTIRELLIYTRYELLQLKHCGKLTADEIEFQLEERYNVKLRPVTFR